MRVGQLLVNCRTAWIWKEGYPPTPSGSKDLGTKHPWQWVSWTASTRGTGSTPRYWYWIRDTTAMKSNELVQQVEERGVETYVQSREYLSHELMRVSDYWTVRLSRIGPEAQNPAFLRRVFSLR